MKVNFHRRCSPGIVTVGRLLRIPVDEGRTRADRGVVHYAFEGVRAACGRTKQARRPVLVREPERVTCVECRRVIEKLGGAR